MRKMAKKAEPVAVADSTGAATVMPVADIDFLLRIIQGNTTIPVLLTDDAGNILNHRNFELPEPPDSLNPLALSAANEEFLTVLPTNQITEGDFWNDKNDLDNVRAGAYRQLTISDVTKRILYWGELRSDNFSQNDMTQTDITYLQNAILQPTQGMFKWGHFYTGINYCNKVLERGEQMFGRKARTEPTPWTIPSVSMSVNHPGARMSLPSCRTSS